MTARDAQMEACLSTVPGLPTAASDLVVERARRGDLGAQEQIYRAYEGPVYNLARRICATAEDAEEVLQETFIEVFRSLRRYRAEGTLWAWVRKIAASKALMRLRSDRLRHTEQLDESIDFKPTPDAGPALSRRLDLEDALALLTDTARAVVWLHDVEGYTHEEIAELMNRSVSFSKSQLSRAHARLRHWLGGWA